MCAPCNVCSYICITMLVFVCVHFFLTLPLVRGLSATYNGLHYTLGYFIMSFLSVIHFTNDIEDLPFVSVY